jgi:lysophospholipase L1-like esterase
MTRSTSASLVLSFLAALAISLAAIAGDPPNRQVTLKKGDRILFFGDSLTYLAGIDGPKDKGVTKGYVKIVQETLDKTHKDLGIKVDWVATGGHTVPDLLKRLDKDVLPKKPTIVVIQIGCNDARRKNMTKESFKASLEELIDRLQKEKIQVIQCTLTSVGEKHDGTNPADKALEEFAEVQRQVIKAKNVPYNDLRKAFVAYWKANNPDNKASGILTYDGNHWNDTGMQFVADQILKRFK